MVKYVYWLPPAEARRLGRRLETEGLDVFEVNKAVCIPLSEKHEVALVPPNAWSEYRFCRRQLSWYQGSPFRGLTLLVSTIEPPGAGLRPETVIRARTDFKPPRLPGADDLPGLTARPGYRRSRPKAWEDIHSEDPAQLEQWLKVMGLSDIRFEDLFRYHCANHANFIDPVWHVGSGNGKEPYSIAGTARVCSACLEFYNLIGRNWPRKWVVPCPGAVRFAGLAGNVYYEVVSPAAGGPAGSTGL
ncbi:MAG: hypothetical protein KKB20_16410 [Proteobacteria bacterium]|nr:hypothetical protein [Pseudomonadota bacterium]